MSLSEPYDDRMLADIAAAADGTLPPGRQAELEAMAEDDEHLAAALDEQRRAVSLIRGAAAEVRAPLALRERLEADRVRLARPRARRRWLSVGLAGAVAAVALLAVVLAAPSGAPTVQDAAAFSAKPPTGAAPAGDGTALPVAEDGIVFPDWLRKFGWNATGKRTGEIDGRPATTIYYEKDGKTLAYTIVSGDALDSPEDSRTVTVEGTPIDIFRTDSGKTAVTWERNGRTCVMTGAGVPEAKLTQLAGWRAKGQLKF
jgi:hypothetical protein